MRRMTLRTTSAILLLAAGLLCLSVPSAVAQTTEPPTTGSEESTPPSTANPPAYIGDLMKSGNLKQAQVDQMRTDGLGWGEVRIATRLAERIAANSNGTLDFDAALKQVLAERTAGKGFGEIAAENNLKVGELVNEKKTADAETSGKAQATGEAAKEKKPGFLSKVAKFFGFGKPADKPATDVKGEKPERPSKVDRADKSEKPEKPEKPAAAERPSRPEKPEKGPNK
jgi:hypothetical protein